MSLQYLSGVSGELGRSKKRAARKETRVAKRAAKKETRVARRATKRGNVETEPVEVAVQDTPVRKSRVKKALVQQKLRRVFKKKSEPIAVKEEEITETPEQEVEQTEQAEQTEQENNGDEQGMGLIYPQYIGRAKRKKKEKTKGKLKSKLKEKIKKAKERRKNDTHSKKDKALHKFAKVAMAVPRGAFLSIILLGKALEKTPIKINLAKRLKDSWSTKGKQIKEAWYKLGGEPDILIAQINKATGSQLTGLGIAVATATTASLATASPIVVKLLKILGKAKDFAEKNPKLVAAGQAVAKKGIDKAASKGNRAENYNKALAIADVVTSALPPETQSKINNIRKNLPDKLVKGVEAQSETEIQDTKDAQKEQETATDTSSGSSNKNLMIGLGAAALIGTYLIVKKKKK